MSSFQYYEWQTIDRPLTAQERAGVEGLSSHIDVSTTRAQVDYSWGDFKHDPKQVLIRYFDAFLYWTNWGSKQLVFRFPAHLLDLKRIESYCVHRYIVLKRVDDVCVLEINLDEEDSWDWIEPEGQLGMLSPLRNDILQGDYRALYLAWLKAMEILSGYELDENEPEPSVPPGLKKLSAELKAFVEFIELDAFLLQAAAIASPKTAPPSERLLKEAVASLSRAECDDFLLRLLRNEPHLHLTLNHRLQQMSSVSSQQETTQTPRTLGTLIAASEALEHIELKRRQAAAESKRLRKLDDLALRKDKLWLEVERQIETYQPKAYDAAVATLKQLRDLAEHQGNTPAFQKRITALHERYSRRTGLRSRMRDAGLE